MKNEISKSLNEILGSLGVADAVAKVDFPESLDHGDFTSNAAMVYAKKLGMPPRALAEKIAAEFGKDLPVELSGLSIAGPGFINFTVKGEVIAKEVVKFAESAKTAGLGSSREGRFGSVKSLEHGSAERAIGKILIEYTDPNTFKVFHIGHLMSNAIGESLSRLIEWSGAKVVRICYPSDIGLHIAKAIWAIQKHAGEMPKDGAAIQERTDFLGKMYVEGTAAYENDIAAKDDIDALNRIIYAKSSPEINALYEKGRKWSLEHFDALYEKLGTRFDDFIYESEMAPVGLDIVRHFLKKGIFEESEGATVFKGEPFGLHTRVFVSSQGIPTYEAKDLGLNLTKFKKHPDAIQSVIVTASEQNDYFKVLTKVISLIDEKDGAKTRHIGHGMMRFAEGKMSSRTGNVVTADSLITDIKALVKERIADRGFSPSDAEEIATDVAVGAIKYTILRSSVGSDIVFDSAASISFEGDSGPYLQYSAVRAASVQEKSENLNPKSETNSKSKIQKIQLPQNVGLLEKLIMRFPDIAERARVEYAPQIIANYLINLAGAFNGFYASQTIIDDKDPLTPYRLALTRAFKSVMTDGLWLLGIKVPKKM